MHGVFYGSLRLKDKVTHFDRVIAENDYSVLLAYNGFVYLDNRGGGGTSMEVQNAQK